MEQATSGLDHSTLRFNADVPVQLEKDGLLPINKYSDFP